MGGNKLHTEVPLKGGVDQKPPHSHFPGFNYKHVLIVLLVALIARFSFMAFMPTKVRSTDTASWENAVAVLDAGQNPYRETPVLNWPPLWLQLIYLMSRVSITLDVPFFRVLQTFLTCADALVILVLFHVIRQIAPQVRPLVPILLGIALNPAVILLTCQHGNFDVIVALWVLLFVSQLVEYNQSKNSLDWLAACVFLGLGILTKTVPLALCPMLAGGLRRVAWKFKWLGLALVFGPVALGMSVIYVLAPEDVLTKVLAYRSINRMFGISGLLNLAGAENRIGLSDVIFYLLLTTGGILVAIQFWRREKLQARAIALCAALFLAAIPGLGPGYSPTYIYWFLPLLIISGLLYRGFWRWAVVVFLGIAATTYLVEYALYPSHGMYLIHILFPTPSEATEVYQFPADYPKMDQLKEWIERVHIMYSRQGQILTRMPLFICYLAILVNGIWLFARDLRAENRPRCLHLP